MAQLAARRSHNPKVVGSIPTLCTQMIDVYAPLAQLVAHWSYVPKVRGSSPRWCTITANICRISLVGQDSWLSPGRHGFDSRMRYNTFKLFYKSLMRIERRAAIAQLGERQTEDLKVPGSIPGGGTHILYF